MKNVPAGDSVNIDDILHEIRDEIKHRNAAAASTLAYSSSSMDDTYRRETGFWVKARKANMKLKNSRFYVFFSPMAAFLNGMFGGFRYRNNISVPDLISLSDEDFLRACYFKILGRKPDEEGMRHHLLVLRTGESDKIGVINSFLRSKEAKRRKAKIDGLFLYNIRRFFVRIPIIGYFIRLFFSVLLLPKRLKEISSSIDRISSNVDSMNKAQLYLKEKIKDITDRSGDTRWK